MAVLCRTSLKPKQQDSPTYSSFEPIIVSTQSKQTRLTLAVIYRPPTSNLTCFFDEFDDLLTHLNARKEPILVCGDFNIHVLKTNDGNVRKFCDILSQYELVQHANGPTHVSGNTIDLVLSRDSDKIAHSTAVSTLISDHFLVKTELNLSKEHYQPSSSEFRKLKSMDIDAFKKEIGDKLQSVEPSTNLDTEITRFESIVRSVLDSHAPIIKRNGKRKPIQPWYDDEVHTAKRQRRSAERKWKQKPTSPGRTKVLKGQTIKVNRIITKKKTQFNNRKVKENAKNS